MFTNSSASEVMMKDQNTLIHLEYESDQDYDNVIAAFEAATGTITSDDFRQAVAASGGNVADKLSPFFTQRNHYG